jgi:hypothetical protein
MYPFYKKKKLISSTIIHLNHPVGFGWGHPDPYRGEIYKNPLVSCIK